MNRRSFLKGLLTVPFVAKALAREPEQHITVTGTSMSDDGDLVMSTEKYPYDPMPHGSTYMTRDSAWVYDKDKGWEKA